MKKKEKRLNNKSRHWAARMLSVFVILAMFGGMVGMPQEVEAKSKTSYSVKVHNINSNTVMKKGSKLKINYTATQKKNGVSKSTKVKFRSSNKKVATVSKKGVIKAKKKGTAYITVYCKKKPGKKKKIKIRVGTPVSSISVSGTRWIRKGRVVTFKASPNSGATNKAVSWWSDNTSVATVNSSGKVTAKGAGQANIYATAKDGSGISGVRTVYVRKFNSTDKKWIAHRGLHTSATENSAAAFRAAANTGFWGIECDIWETKHVTPAKEPLPAEPEVTGSASEFSVEGSAPDQEVDDVTETIRNLNITNDEAADSIEVIDNAEQVKAAMDSYESLDDSQKYQVMVQLGKDPADNYILDYFFMAVRNIGEYESYDIIINHDDSYKRVFGVNSGVRAMTVDDIKANSKLNGKVCFFDEYIRICNNADKVPVVEIKSGSQNFSTEKTIKKMVDQIVDQGGTDLLKKTVFISFSASILTGVKNYIERNYGYKPETYFLFSSNGIANTRTAADKGFTGISVKYTILDNNLRNEASKHRLKVGTWTYDDTAKDDGYVWSHLDSYDLEFMTLDYKIF